MRTRRRSGAGRRPAGLHEVRAALLRARRTGRCERLLRPHLAAYSPDDRESWEATLLALWDEATHREERYAALALGRHRVARPWRDPASLDLWRHLVVTGAWWDLVDETASHLVGDVLARHRAAATPIVLGWATDDDLWLRRTAVIAQLRPPRADRPAPADARRSRATSTTARSGCARRSAGRCASTPGPTRTGCGRASTAGATGSRRCPAARGAQAPVSVRSTAPESSAGSRTTRLARADRAAARTAGSRSAAASR